jgi:hypothetical protein
MEEAKENVLAHSSREDFVYRHFPQPHWRKIWCTNRVALKSVTAGLGEAASI